MGAGVSAGQPVYLTRSTMLISHTPVNQTPGAQNQCSFRRQSTAISTPGSAGSMGTSSGGIVSQMAFPIQMYPNNVYNNNGFSAHVNGFENAIPTTPPAARRLTIATSSPSNHQHPRPPVHPSAPAEETPPAYSSIYPNLANRVN